jgi:diacylglycerol kinase family enzyme
MTNHRRVAVLLNVNAGAVERLGKDKVREVVAAAFERHGMTATISFAAGADLQAALEQARDAATAGRFDALAVGGGDGSVSTAASVLIGSSVPLAILPLGTLNHFARDLCIPLALDEAVAVIGSGRLHAVDVGEVNGRTFINNSSIGIYPFLVLDRERRRRGVGLRKWTAMALAAWRVLREFPLHRLIINALNWREPVRTPCVFVGNNEYGLTLANFGKRARVDCGELCLYVSKPQSRLSLIGLAYRCMFGLIREEDDLRIIKVQDAEISSRQRGRLLVAFDGEVEKMRPPLRYRTRPGALRVLAPAPE